MKYTFTCQERLKSKKLISKLFKEGKALNLYPIRVIYLPGSPILSAQNQALFIVPKKKCPGAVLRNTLKRRMREAYRLNKPLLATKEHSSIHFIIGYLYIGPSELGEFKAIQEKIIQALKHLKKIHEKAHF